MERPTCFSIGKIEEVCIDERFEKMMDLSNDLIQGGYGVKIA
jgi:hypothetical protein